MTDRERKDDIPVPTFSIITKGGKKRLTKAERLKKQKKIKIITGVGAVLFLLFMIWGFQPLRGTTNMGVCRILAESRLIYPETLRITSYENNEPYWRLYYTYTGSFGEHRSDMIDCGFSTDQATGAVILTDLRFNRKKVSPEELRKANISLAAIIAYKPDTILPRPPPEGDLTALKPPH